MYEVKVTKMLSINVFKQHPCYKIALRNETVLNCYLKFVGSKPEMIFSVFGARKYMV